MAYDQLLADRVRPLLSRKRNFAEKKMFGGVGFLLRGNMCVGVWKEFLIVRLGVERQEAVMSEPYVLPFDITGKPMRGWAMIEPDGLQNEKNLQRWVEAAVDFVAALPDK